LVGEVTHLLQEWRAGDDAALDRLIPLVYQELRGMARRCLRGERAPDALQPTALVNEAYLRLVGSHRVEWRDRAHFFAVAATLMRRVLVDEARKRHALKRGGDCTRIALSEEVAAPAEQDVDLLALDDALERLAEEAPRKARVVELRYFGALTIEETAAVLGVSIDIVKRDWRSAKLWLTRALKEARHGTAAVGSHR
jgi:RNA polymerase sigma-70 factor (ECF subfamily)